VWQVRSFCTPTNHRSSVLCLLPKARYQTAAVELAPNDCVLFFTDGLIEDEQDDGQLFGVERLIDSLRRNDTPPENLLENVENDARFFAGKSTFEDDICLLAVWWVAR